jgi:hypothetical protein
MSEPRQKDLNELERLLASLSPRPANLDRDRLLFRAGQESRRRHWVWRMATLGVAGACVCLTLMIVLRPAPEPLVRIVKEQVVVYVPAPESQASVAMAPQSPVAYAPGSPDGMKAQAMSYWQMHQQALRFGVDGLPSSAAESEEHANGPVRSGQNLTVGSRPQLDTPAFLSSFGVP